MLWNENDITSLIALIVKETIKGKSIRVKLQVCTALQYCTLYSVHLSSFKKLCPFKHTVEGQSF